MSGNLTGRPTGYVPYTAAKDNIMNDRLKSKLMNEFDHLDLDKDGKLDN